MPAENIAVDCDISLIQKIDSLLLVVIHDGAEPFRSSSPEVLQFDRL